MIELLSRFSGVARERITANLRAIANAHDPSRNVTIDAIGGGLLGFAAAAITLLELLR